MLRANLSPVFNIEIIRGKTAFHTTLNRGCLGKRLGAHVTSGKF